jgi:NAD(P)-dependent dehydrogenase (short-subunit alcohol dehydrogenase family)
MSGLSLLRATAAVLILSLGVAQADELLRPTVMITGASRGIGLELARQYAERGWGVIATARNPASSSELQALAEQSPGVVLETLDVTDQAQIDSLAEKLRAQPIDILINNAGILGDIDGQRFGQFDFAVFDRIMAVNTKGPLRVTEAFIDHVAASEQKKIMNVSSAVGSIKLAFGGQTFYRSSKAALNMAMRNLSKEMRRSKDPNRKQLIFGLIDPGVVDTGFAKNVPIPMINADESAAGVITVIDAFVDRRQSGSFYTYTGKEMPW